MKLLQLTRGMFAKIDNDDFDRIMAQGRWQAVVGYNTWYAATSFKVEGTRKSVKVLLHRFVMNCHENDGLRVDHLNENGLDCQKENLRIASAALNAHNRKEKLANNTSGYEGVYWSNQKRKWVGEIIWKGKKYYVGSNTNIEIVAALRKRVKDYLLQQIEINGENASLNLKDAFKIAVSTNLEIEGDER